MYNIEELSKHFEMSINEVKYLLRQKDPFCKCGKLKKLFKSPQSKIGKALYRTCGAPKCDPKYGIKRPKHSAYMKELAANGMNEAYNRTLMKKGKLFNKEVNTINYKRKILANKGYDVKEATEDDILQLFFAYSSKNMKSTKFRIKKILTQYNNWEQKYKDLILIITHKDPNEIDFTSLTDDEIERMFKRIHGINTIRNWSNVKESRTTFFKRIYLDNFKYNAAGQKSVVTRSGLEAVYINYFENNAIPWEYETLILNNTDNSGFHTPDFIITYENQKMIVETKGDFFRQDFDDYLEKNIKACFTYCKEHNMKYVLTTVENPEKKSFLEHALIKE